MREIVLDTETTGLDPNDGHRIVEIACIELDNQVPTGRRFQRWINPERDMPADALLVHGLTSDFLRRQPVFAEIVDELLDFIGTAPLVIHNAEFDLAFLNAELTRLGRAPIGSAHVDTLSLAREKFPGAPASLDALCRRFSIDASERIAHGAEIDCALLAAVYIELLGGRQPGLEFVAPGEPAIVSCERVARPPRPHAASAEELLAHRATLAMIADALWLAEN